MLYLLILILVAGTVVLLLRMRVRCTIDGDDRRLFVGLGRSGGEFDFVKGRGVFKLFGLRVKDFDLARKAPAEVREKPEPEEKPEAEKKPRTERVRSRKRVLEVAKKSLRPSWDYLVGLLRSLILEEMHGTIRGGFDSPDLTGQAYGYYQAAIGAVPALAGRVSYVPDFTGQSFSGDFRMSVALPVYRLVYRTTRYLFALPLRKLIKLAIGTKERDKGEQDV